MRTLILSCNTGEGHNSCAKAIKDVFDERNLPCDMEDSLRFISPGVSRMICKGHTFIYRNIPILFTKGYTGAEKHSGVFREDKPIARFLCRGTDALAKFIRSNGYDHVICVHPFVGIAMRDVLRHHPMNIRLSIVATDYTCNPGTEQCPADWFFSPDPTLQDRFTDQGISPSRIIASGIPVRQTFYDRENRETAKLACCIAPGHKHLLVMSGSMGCGPIRELMDLLVAHIPPNVEISVLASSNSSLKQTLEQKYNQNPHVHIYGFHHNISQLMDSADLFVTKPGGLSVSEAATKGLPMVLIDAVAGCEAHNLRFFCDLGGAVAAKEPKELDRLCQQLLQDDEKRAHMAAQLAPFAQRNAANIIFETHCQPQPNLGA